MAERSYGIVYNNIKMEENNNNTKKSNSATSYRRYTPLGMDRTLFFRSIDEEKKFFFFFFFTFFLIRSATYLYKCMCQQVSFISHI